MNKNEAAREILEILHDFADKNCTTVKMLLSKDRKHRNAALKRAAMRRIRKETDLNYAQIGRIFKVHHATVVQACKSVGKDYEGAYFKEE